MPGYTTECTLPDHVRQGVHYRVMYGREYSAQRGVLQARSTLRREVSDKRGETALRIEVSLRRRDCSAHRGVPSSRTLLHVGTPLVEERGPCCTSAHRWSRKRSILLHVDTPLVEEMLILLHVGTPLVEETGYILLHVGTPLV